MTINTILITGCTKGIGRALALRFSQENCKVYAVGRTQKQLDSLTKLSERIHPICADITTPVGRNDIYHALKDEPSFSIIHNAGVAVPCSFENMEEASLRLHFETNFFGPLLLTQRFLKQLQGQRVLNISSGAALMALENKLPYCTSKGVMHHAIECLHKELAKQGVYFTNLRPGMVDTPLQESLRNMSLEALPTRDFYIRAKTEGRLISPEKVAEFVARVMLKTSNQDFAENFWDIDGSTPCTKDSKKLISGGFTVQQAETQAAVMLDVIEDQLATKRDLKELEVKLETKMVEMESRLLIRLGAMIFSGLIVCTTILGILITHH